MFHRDLCSFSVTPAAALLSRCVSRGALTQVRGDVCCFQRCWRCFTRVRLQELLDAASTGLRPTFSPQLQEAQERIRMQKQLDEVLLMVLRFLLSQRNPNAGLDPPVAAAAEGGAPEGGEEER